MNRLIVDMTTYAETHRSFIECFGIKEKEYLMEDYFISRDREELSTGDFLSYIGNESAPILDNPIQLNSLHITTNDDGCSTIRNLGILDLRKAVTQETPLRQFLIARGIQIDVSTGELNANGVVFQLNPNAQGSSALDAEDQLDYVSWKIYKDFPVCGFICTPNALSYGGHVDRRPEFLNNISKLLNRPELVWEWEKKTQTFIIKFGLPLSKYETPNEREGVGTLLLQTAYDHIFNGGPDCDVYSFLPPHTRVEPEEILEVFEPEVYKSVISG